MKQNKNSSTARGKRSLFRGPPKDPVLASHIKIRNESEARDSVTYLNERWNNSSRQTRVRLVKAANQAANRAGVVSRNERVSPKERAEAREASKVFRAFVNAHKGKE